MKAVVGVKFLETVTPDATDHAGVRQVVREFSLRAQIRPSRTTNNVSQYWPKGLLCHVQVINGETRGHWRGRGGGFRPVRLSRLCLGDLATVSFNMYDKTAPAGKYFGTVITLRTSMHG